MPRPSLYVFDAYGTLFDVHAAASAYQNAIGAGWEKLSQTWRVKHLEYTWVHSMSGRPTTFWALAERSLDFAQVLVVVLTRMDHGVLRIAAGAS